jgi:hypothetical protein
MVRGIKARKPRRPHKASEMRERITGKPYAPETPKDKKIPRWRAHAERDLAMQQAKDVIERHTPKEEKAESEEEPLHELTDGELKEVEKLKSWEKWLKKNKKIPKKVRPETPNKENNYQTQLDKPIHWKALQEKIDKAFKNEGDRRSPKTEADGEKDITEMNLKNPTQYQRGRGVGTPKFVGGKKVPRSEEDVVKPSGNVKTRQTGRMMAGVLGQKDQAKPTKEQMKEYMDIAHGKESGLTESYSGKKESQADLNAKFNHPDFNPRKGEIEHGYGKKKKKSWENWLEAKKDQGQGDAKYGNPHETGMEDARKLQTTADDFSMEDKKEENKKDGKPYIQINTDKR